MKTKWIIIVAAFILIAGGLVYLKFRKSTDFEPLIKAKLQQVVKDGSDGLYVLDMDKIEIDVLASKVVVYNARLSIDSARLAVLDSAGNAPVDVYKISVSALNIDGFNVDDLLSKRNIDLKELTIKNPSFEIFHPVNKNPQISKDTSTLYSRIASSLGHFSLENLVIENMDFLYHNIAKDEKRTSFKDVTMRFKDIEIDSTTQFDTTRFLYAKDALILFNNYSFRTADSLYLVKADSLALHAAKGVLDVTALSLTPRGKKEDFSKKLTYYTDRYDVHIADASFKKTDWYHLIAGEGFAAEEAVLNNGTIEIYSDRNVPSSGKSKVGNYPHQLLMKLDFPLDVKTITLSNFKLTYKELNPKTQKTGSIVFNNIKGSLHNITNIKENIAKDKLFTVKANGLLMGKGSISAVFTFDLTKTPTGDFSVDVDLGPIDGTALNVAAMPLGLFEINSAAIKRLKAHVDGNNYNAKSSVLFIYDDLKITALKSDDEGKLKGRGLISFIANTFIIHKSNPRKNETAKPEQASFKRDPERSFFFLTWKSIMQGIIGVVK